MFKGRRRKSYDDELRLGRYAKEILETPGWTVIVDELRQRAVQDWKEAESIEAREAAHARAVALDAIEEELQRLSNGVPFAERQLEKLD